MESTLYERLAQQNKLELLSLNEQNLLKSADVRKLTAQEQWNYLQTNRNTGLWITRFVGWIRLFLIIGGGISTLFLMLEKVNWKHPGGNWVELLFACGGLALAVWGLMMAKQLKKKLAELNRKLPPLEEIGIP